MHFKSLRSFALASLTLLGLAASHPAQADNPIYVESSNSQFGILNPTTGAYTLIGTTSELLGGLGFGANGQLYAIGYGRNGPLYAVNTATAGMTFIGNTGLNTSSTSLSYTFGSTSDGTIYTEVDGTSYRVDPATAAATTLGPLGFIYGGALNGDDKGNLFILGDVNSTNFYQVNRTTGQAALIGRGGYGSRCFGLADSGGVLYAINTTGSIFSVNTATAASTQTATYDTRTAGVVYAAAAQPSPVPEVSSVVSLGLLLLLGLGGVAVSRRRKVGAKG